MEPIPVKNGEIRVLPLAYESFGVRGMATYVETDDVKLVIDPGSALGPRFRLNPHEQEYMAHLADHRPMGGPSDAQREAYLWLQEEFVRACEAAGLDPAEPTSRRWANHNFSAHQRRKRERNQAE